MQDQEQKGNQRLRELEPAIRMAFRMGFVPIPLQGKKPVLPGWPKIQMQQAIGALEEGFTRKQANNVGINCGKKSGIVVVDIDIKNQGLETWNRLKSMYGEPQTFTVKTGSGGYHYYFRYDSDNEMLKSRSGAIQVNGTKVGIDIKTNGGQVVFISSIHPDTGGQYELVNDTEIGTMPTWLLAMLLETESTTTRTAPAPAPRSVVPRPAPRASAPPTRTPVKIVDQPAAICEEALLELVHLLHVDRASNYDDWIRGVWAIKNVSSQYYHIARQFSQRTQRNNYDPAALRKVWQQGKPGSIGLGSLLYWLKCDLDAATYTDFVKRHGLKLKKNQIKEMMLVLPEVRTSATPTSHFNGTKFTASVLYNERYVRPFDFLPGTSEQQLTVAVRSAMGTGKTQSLNQYLKQYSEYTVKMITPRRTLARYLEKNFGFQHYKDLPPGDITAKRVIIQAESLHRLSLKDTQNSIVILDEFNSVLQQMCCLKTHGDKHAYNVSTLEMLLMHAGTVIAMDADLGEAELQFLQTHRPRAQLKLIENIYSPFQQDSYLLTSDRDRWKQELLYVMCELRHKVSIPTTQSPAQAQALYQTLTDFGFRGLCITSKTSEAEKERIFSNLEQSLAGLDFVIYSPSCSVGVSYDVEHHFQQVFAYFEVQSGVTTEQCRQMMRRVRHPEQKRTVIYCSAQTEDRPTTPEQIEAWIASESRLSTKRNVLRPGSLLRATRTLDDTLAVQKDFFYSLYVYCLQIKNLSAQNFRQRLSRQLIRDGGQVRGLEPKLEVTPGQGEMLKQGLELNKKLIAQVKQQQLDSVAGAREVFDTPEHQLLKSQARNEATPLSEQDRDALQKAQLREWYNFGIEHPIDAQFVSTYSLPSMKERYRNLTILTDRELDVLESLEAYRLSSHQNVLLLAPQQQVHLRQLLKPEPIRYRQLATALDLLQKSGFAPEHVLTTDTDSIPIYTRAQMGQLMDRLKLELRTEYLTLRQRFGIGGTGKKQLPKVPEENWEFARQLQFLNAIFSACLGIKIRHGGSRKSGFYTLYQDYREWFDIQPSSESKPCISPYLDRQLPAPSTSSTNHELEMYLNPDTAEQPRMTHRQVLLDRVLPSFQSPRILPLGEELERVLGIQGDEKEDDSVEEERPAELSQYREVTPQEMWENMAM